MGGTARGPGHRRAVDAVERWGMPVVPLSFLTVGLQSAVHGACGLLRLRWLRYTLWSVPGWLVWALVWAGWRHCCPVGGRRAGDAVAVGPRGGGR